MKDTGGTPSENGSNSSGGNNSDNSALVSLGNTSFGFNFESDGGYNNSSGSTNSEEGNSEGGDSDQGGDPTTAAATTNTTRSTRTPIAAAIDTSSNNEDGTSMSDTNHNNNEGAEQRPQSHDEKPSHQERTSSTEQPPSGTTTGTNTPMRIENRNTMTAGAAAASKVSSGSSTGNSGSSTAVSTTSTEMPSSFSTTASTTTTSNSSHTNAASAAVANLNSIATAAIEGINSRNSDEARGLKRKANDPMSDDDSGGYNTDDDEGGKVSSKSSSDRSLPKVAAATSSKSLCTSTGQEKEAEASSIQGEGSKGGGKKKKKLDEGKREERNAREKERSFRIAKQINELRGLLSSGGVIVPKGTKSSVLTEAANYIRMLQQHQYRSEIDRHQLVQQVQRIGSGALGTQAATAVRHVAAQNGVWSLGNFGGVPPKSAMMYHQPSGPTADETTSSPDAVESNGSTLSNSIAESDYRHVFNSCTVGMAIASMGGAFIDCNKLFCQLSNYSKQEVCSMTVFNLTSRQDLQSAFDLISQMLSAPLDPTANTACVLRGALKNRSDIGLNVKLIKGSDSVAKCFCVTLILNPDSPYDTSKPTPATLANGIANSTHTGQALPSAKDPAKACMNPVPAYTTG